MLREFKEKNVDALTFYHMKKIQWEEDKKKFQSAEEQVEKLKGEKWKI